MSDGNNNQGTMNYLSVGRLGNIKAVNYSGVNFSVQDALNAGELRVASDEEVTLNGNKVSDSAKTTVNPGDTILILRRIEGND